MKYFWTQINDCLKKKRKCKNYHYTQSFPWNFSFHLSFKNRKICSVMRSIKISAIEIVNCGELLWEYVYAQHHFVNITYENIVHQNAITVNDQQHITNWFPRSRKKTMDVNFSRLRVEYRAIKIKLSWL